MKKGIGIGIEDFSEIIKENCYYIDKTKWIEEILEDKSKIKLFTRPRRFGKTLNMSMIKYFFDVKNKDENKTLFENLKISDSKYMNEQGKYPVIFISLKDLKADTWEMCRLEIKKVISKLYREFQYITEKMDEDDKEIYNSIKNRKNDIDLNTSLELLSDFLCKYYGKKVIVLIDEYDSPI
ncbi:AAA family ATPase, partial [uncultured Leptotrichia sp.]|uniref:AAA family ATPase n=1 Tax=uncultured Leptotrichia sp. TaxID=159271 RepID=UPI00260C64BF